MLHDTVRTPLRVLVFLLAVATATAQNKSISGIINIYTPVVSLDGCRDLVVENPSGFGVGDLVLVIQMQGATIYPHNDGDYGTVTDLGHAGNHELGRIAAIAGPVISLEGKLTRGYTAAGHVQMVRVPEYTDVSVDGDLTCTPWDGCIGGVLACIVSGTLTLNADLDGEIRHRT